MNYYKISFNREITQNFNVFRANFNLHYKTNVWSSDAHPFYLLATTEAVETVREKLDLSLGPQKSQWPGFADMGLQIHPLEAGDFTLPAEAQTWLSNMRQAVQRLSEFCSMHQKQN